MLGCWQVFWQSASMLHIGAQPGPPEVELPVPVVDVVVPVALVPVVAVVPGPVPVVAVVPGPEVVGWPLVVAPVEPNDTLPPPPPAPAPVSLLPDAQAAMSPALHNAMRTKVVLACFTGVW